jgi:hypothetical protein
LSFIEIGPQEWYNKILERWPNGTPTNNNEEFAAGDTTVLATSARYGQNIFELNNLKHSELIEKTEGQQKILELLGLSTNNISLIPSETFTNTMVFQLASPATLIITDPQGQEIKSDKLVVIPDALTGNYRIKVMGTATGTYTLYAGQIKGSEDSWLNLSAPTASGQQDLYTLTVPDQPGLELAANAASINQTDAKTKINQLKNYVNTANFPVSNRRITLDWLNNILRAYDRQQYEQAILLLYQLRAQNSDRTLKNKVLEIIAVLEKVYLTFQAGSYNPSKLVQEKALAQKYFAQFENKLKGSTKATKDHAWLWEKTQEKLQAANNQASFASHIRYLGVQYLAQEGLKLLK